MDYRIVLIDTNMVYDVQSNKCCKISEVTSGDELQGKLDIIPWDFLVYTDLTESV